ncbi:hypothetical protein VB773_21165 [Haloarculaceae archaeon H-GB2-1]|nr:hypothetical protein [Haloarculaceae archaeon H-GB1-1]MEA5409831.1 hypothetical protein [Haloarculaceae archaeon H-GB2-1]
MSGQTANQGANGITESDHEAADEASSRRGSGPVARTLKRSLWNGVLAGVTGVGSIVLGVRAIRAGEYNRGLSQLAVGMLLATIAVGQRRGDEETQSDDTRRASPGTSISVGERSHETDAGGAPAETEGASADAPTAGDTVETEPTETDARGPEAVVEGAQTPSEAAPTHERLGEAAFDEHSNEVPVPQQVFDLELLTLGSEAVWGVRESDDAVLVSPLFDPIQERSDVRYVGSSEIDDERMLSVPDVVIDHWDAAAGGGRIVTSGTDLVFVTSDELRTDRQVQVVPEQWVDDVLGEAEE